MAAHRTLWWYLLPSLPSELTSQMDRAPGRLSETSSTNADQHHIGNHGSTHLEFPQPVRISDCARW